MSFSVSFYEPTVSSLGASVSVGIRTLNEAMNRSWFLRRMPSYMDKVVIVDGCSPDHTADVACALRVDVIVVDEQRKGKGAATIRLSRTSPPSAPWRETQ